MKIVGTSDSKGRIQPDADAVLDLATAKPNVVTSVHLDGTSAGLRCSPLIRDFIDVSELTYIGGGLHVRDRGEDAWSRGFEFGVPVFDPGAWASGTTDLASTLGLLSGVRDVVSWAARKGRTS